MVVKVSPSTPAGGKGFKMTDYIEQLMKTAGVKPTVTYFEKVNPLAEISSAKSVTKARNFTAEKQLELIKLLSKNRIGKDYKILEIEQDEIDNLCYFSLTNKDNRCQSTYVSNQDFTQALAQLTIKLMNAGELDKEKVKEIFEG